MYSKVLFDWANEFLYENQYACSRKKISGFAIDSREVKKDNVFFAIKGERSDGCSFLREVAEKGAVAAVVPSDYSGPDFGMDLLLVPDVIASIRSAAQKFFIKHCPSMIGITGSVGKTTVKDFLTVLLSSGYNVSASPKSYNSQITMPLSILMSSGFEDFLVLEMAASEPGNIAALMDIAVPEIAVITNVLDQHALFYPGGVKDIFKEKVELFSAKKTKVHLFPKDSEFFQDFLSINPEADKFSFSLTDMNADFFYRAIHDQGVVIRTPSGDCRLDVIFPYKPAYVNFLIAVAVSWIAGLVQEDIATVVHQLKLPPMRFEKTERNGVVIINDAYNASPDAMIAALEAIPIPKPGNKVVLILGHMAELGSASEEGHIRVAALALSKANIVIFVGHFWSVVKSLSCNFDCEVEFCDDVDSILGKVPGILRKGDVVLLKGSRVCRLETILNYL